MSSHCQLQVQERHVLAISDTSEINLQAHIGRIDGEGVGVLALPIEEKESFKWLESAMESSRCLETGGVSLVTHIGDREADIYEEWVRVPRRGHHVLIRVCRDRLIAQSSNTLFNYLSEQPCQGTYHFTVAADKRKGRVQREALMAVRFVPVTIARPQRLKGTDYPTSVSLYAVEAYEVQPPPGQSPIHWRLLTTHPVMILEQALQVIQWYSWRWQIEQLFAILKRGGFDIEATQLESGRGIQRLCVLALAAAVQVLQLQEGRDDPDQAASVVFSQRQQQCLSDLAPTLQGQTQKQQNPYPPYTLAWASWLIARLGGWSGFQSQRPPGIRTLFKGLQKFEGIFQGWSLVHDQDVYTR